MINIWLNYPLNTDNVTSKLRLQIVFYKELVTLSMNFSRYDCNIT